MTYDELLRKTPIWAYAQNRELVDEMPGIVKGAQELLEQRLDHDIFRTTLPSVDVGTDGILALQPGTVFEIRAVRIEHASGTGYYPLRSRDIETCHALYGNHEQGLPHYWAYVDNDTIEVFPKPWAQMSVVTVVNAKPPTLGPTQQTNVISTDHPRPFEKAVLMQIGVFMLDDSLIQKYLNELNDAVTEANAQIVRRRRDETSQRPRETRNLTGG
jgi:hypothetical protein